MTRWLRISWNLLAMAALVSAARGDLASDAPVAAPASDQARVYGEWRIRVRPDQGPAYDSLIEKSGLPLFRQAGGRMVGWWKTLIGDLYEHVTIWEYDDMAAFEKAVQFLGKNADFAKFVAARDPLLSGEESRFLRLAPGAVRPALPERASFVVHEIHRVSPAHQAEYLALMNKEGRGLLQRHGIRPVGPWVVEVGRWSEVTYLFPYESLGERDGKLAKFAEDPDGLKYRNKMSELVGEVTTRLLMPAAFARAGQGGDVPAKPDSAAGLLPHREQVAPGVYAAGFSDRYRSANCGWVALGNETLLIDLPRGIAVPEFLKLIAATTGKPASTLVLTGAQDGDWPIIRMLREGGITRVLTSPAIRAGYLQPPLPRMPPPCKSYPIERRSATPWFRSTSYRSMVPPGPAARPCM